MARNRLCKFMVSRQQWERIKQHAKQQGYLHLAPYLRDLAMKNHQWLEWKMLEVLSEVKQINQKLIQNERKEEQSIQERAGKTEKEDVSALDSDR